MSSVVDFINFLSSTFVGFFVGIFGPEGKEWSLLLVSIVAGVLFLVIYGWVSNQSAIKEVKRKIVANILEAILFRRELKISLKAQARMCGNALWYFLVALPPIFVLMIPCVALLAQLNLYYGVRPIQVGESGILSIKFKNEHLVDKINLKASNGISVTPPVRILENREVFWRVDAKDKGKQEINLSFGESQGAFSKDMYVGEVKGALYPWLYSSWFMRFFYPEEANSAIASQYIESMIFSYPEAPQDFFGLHLHWVLVFAIISILTGVLASRMLGIEI